MDIAIVLNALQRLSGTEVGSLAQFPPNQPNLISIGSRKYLKTGVVALQSAFPAVPFAPVGAFSSSTIAALGFARAAPICFGAGVFVTVSSNFNVQASFQWSADGEKWFSGTQLSTRDGTPWGDSITSIMHDGMQFIAMGANSVWTSADGKTWLMKTNTLQNVRPQWICSQLLKGNGMYVALGGNGTKGDLLTSADLVTWNYAGSPFGTPSSNGGTMYNVVGTFNGKKFIFIASYSWNYPTPTNLSKAFISSTGIDQFATMDAVSADGTSMSIPGGVPNIISQNGNVYFQVAGYLITSTDNGATFSAMPSNGTGEIYPFPNGFYSVGTDAGRGVQISPDGKSWRAMTGLNTPSFYALGRGAYGNNVLVTGTNDSGKAIVFKGFDLLIDNFVATESGGNPYYMKVQS